MTGARYETCRECGLEWNVSKQAVIPWSGYLCPVCRGKIISIHTPTQGVTANINKIYSSYSSIFVYY